jgi:predicted MFS family arabinose efflux permease
VLFLGAAAGVWLGGVLVGRIGFAPVFMALGVALAVPGAVFAADARPPPRHDQRPPEASP